MTTRQEQDLLQLMVKRKNDHIRLCKEEHVEAHQNKIFEKYRIYNDSLPEIDFDDVDTSQNFLGQKFNLPLLITGMTGGVEHGQTINETLALAAQAWNVPMGLGSQKMMIDNPHLKPLFDVHKIAPNVFLIGNLGAVSLNYGVTIDQIERLVESCTLNAFAIHLNALQECIQPEGDRRFGNLLNKIEQLVKKLPVPVIIKEVGTGISAKTFQKLADIGIKAIDIAGVGGTSWSAIEGMRSQLVGQRLGELFREWGIPTDESLQQCVQIRDQKKYDISIIATGGIRHGIHLAKGIGLGASMMGVGLPLFKAAVGDDPLKAVHEEMLFFKESLKIALFCSGSLRLSDLKHKIERISPNV